MAAYKEPLSPTVLNGTEDEDGVVKANGPTGGGGEVPGPHLPAGHPYWTTDWDSLYWPRPVEEEAWAMGKVEHRGKKENAAKEPEATSPPTGGIKSFDDPWLPEIPAPGRPPEEGLGVFVFPEEVEIIDGNPVWTYVSLSPEPKKLKSEIEDTSGGGEN